MMRSFKCQSVAILLAILTWSPLSAGLVVVLDFNDSSQAVTQDIFGDEVTDFDVTGFGFMASDFGMVANAVLDQVKDHYYSIPTMSENILSTIPDGFELDIDFVLGDIGVNPGASEYYYLQIGSATVAGQPLGQAGGSVIRTSGGGVDQFGLGNGFVMGSVFTNNINGLGGVGTALTSGNLAATVHALAGTISHEIGHALSLGHVAKAGSVTPTGLSPLMGTGAIDLPNVDRISPREFSFAASNGSNNISQLAGAVGLRVSAVPEPSSAMMFVVATCLVTFRRRARA